MVSSIILPAHAQTSPSETAFECQFSETFVVQTTDTSISLSTFIDTEAGIGTDVRIILEDPGDVAYESGGDFVLTGAVGTSEGGTETFVAVEGSTEVIGGLIGTSLTLDVDIGDDGEIDCSTDVTVAAPGGP